MSVHFVTSTTILDSTINYEFFITYWRRMFTNTTTVHKAHHRSEKNIKMFTYFLFSCKLPQLLGWMGSLASPTFWKSVSELSVTDPYPASPKVRIRIQPHQKSGSVSSITKSPDPYPASPKVRIRIQLQQKSGSVSSFNKSLDPYPASTKVRIRIQLYQKFVY